MKILIAEDDLTSRIALAAVLERLGHEVVVTKDGGAAWEVLRAPEAPRLAILDWMMPLLDGVELVRKVRALHAALPPWLVMLTTKSETGDLVTALEAGADDFLRKPFDAGELRARLGVGVRVLELQATLGERIAALEAAAGRIRQLEGMLPICSYCKQIRDEQGEWRRVDHYIERHSSALFTHSICPTCLETHDL